MHGFDVIRGGAAALAGPARDDALHRRGPAIVLSLQRARCPQLAAPSSSLLCHVTLREYLQVTRLMRTYSDK